MTISITAFHYREKRLVEVEFEPVASIGPIERVRHDALNFDGPTQTSGPEIVHQLGRIHPRGEVVLGLKELMADG